MDFREIQLAYLEVPPITRAYTTACFMTTIFVHLDVITPYTLYYNLRLIIMKYQIWRLVTPFCYFGPIGFPFLFNMIFTYKYCRMLEESSFRNRTFDMLVMFVFGGVLMLLAASFIDMFFLGQAFNIMFVYIWSRRNPHVQMNFFGMFDFTAPFLPWVLLAFGFLLGNSIEVDVLGISVGHVYYFLEDVLPNQMRGYRVLNVQALVQMFSSRRQAATATNQNADAANNAPQAADDDAPRLRPGGFRWDAADG